jgi:hypothetical protein
MQSKAKSILVLTGVLIIGIIIGALGSSLLRRSMWEERVSRFRTPEGFTERILDRVDPDPDKREAVKNVLIEQHKNLAQRFENTRLQMETHVDSVLMRLEPFLTKEQLERAEHVLKRRSRHMRNRDGKPDGPPRDD